MTLSSQAEQVTKTMDRSVKIFMCCTLVKNESAHPMGVALGDVAFKFDAV
jgi:hypothetical protein